MQHQVEGPRHQVHPMFPFPSSGGRQAPPVLSGPGAPGAKDKAEVHLLTVLEAAGLRCGQCCSFRGLSPRPEDSHRLPMCSRLVPQSMPVSSSLLERTLVILDEGPPSGPRFTSLEALTPIARHTPRYWGGG